MLTQNSKKSSRYAQTLMIRDSGEVSGPAEHFQIKWGQHTVSFEVFRSLSEYEFATFYFDEKTCEIAMQTYSLIFL